MKEAADSLTFTLFFSFDIDFIVVRPERVELALGKPNMLEMYLYLNTIHSGPDFAQGLSYFDKQRAWHSFKDNFLVNASIEVQQLDILSNFEVNFL